MRSWPPQPGAFACALDAWLAEGCEARTPEELPARLQAAQLAALSRSLRHAAAHSALYRRRLQGHDLAPASLAALAALPCTTAADLHPWEALLCVPQGEVHRLVTLHTSGSTGQPKRLAFTRRDLLRTREFFAVGMACLTRPGTTLAVLLPGGQRPDGVADLLRQALLPGGVNVLCPPAEVLHTAQVDALVPWLRATAPQALVVMPTQLARLLAALPDGLPGLAGILASAEPLEPALAAAVRAHWGCELLDHYGLVESGYGCAVECPGHAGRHIRALDVLLEIVSPEDCCPLPPGEVGEVVITTLDREAMPLIRYRTGDLASLLPGACTCGSPLPRLGRVLGRLRREGGVIRVEHPPKGGAWPQG